MHNLSEKEITYIKRCFNYHIEKELPELLKDEYHHFLEVFQRAFTIGYIARKNVKDKYNDIIPLSEEDKIEIIKSLMDIRLKVTFNSVKRVLAKEGLIPDYKEDYNINLLIDDFKGKNEIIKSLKRELREKLYLYSKLKQLTMEKNKYIISLKKQLRDNDLFEEP